MTADSVLVTGGTGFIGRPVVDSLVERGDDVHVVSSKPLRQSLLRQSESVTFHRADLLDQRQVQKLVEKVQASRLLHLAWYVEPGQVWNSLENLRWAAASLELIQAFAAGGGQRAVLAGSGSEYGPNGGICSETETPIAPSNLYGVSKAAVGSMSLAGASALGLEICWARIFSAFGPREHPARLVSSIIKHLLLAEVAPCSPGNQQRDYLSTHDIAGALTRLLESNVCGPVNVGSGEPVELRNLVGRIAGVIGRPDLVRFGAVTPPPDDPPLLVANVSRLRDEAGWIPEFSLDDALQRTVEWWRGCLNSSTG